MVLREKVLMGIGLTALLLNLTLLPIVFTGAVPGAVEDKFSTYPLDTICGDDDDCSSVEENWSISTTTRDYYAWNLENANDVQNNQAAPEYSKRGPYTYDITSEKTLLEHDSSNGELTYNVINSFECSKDSLYSCDEELTQLNIQFRPQIIGATGSAINGIMDLTKIGFASGMMNQDLNTTQAGIVTADYIRSMTNTIGGAGFGSYGYAALGAAEAAGEVSVVIPNTMDGNILPVANFLGGLDDALYSSVHPSDEQFNISLLNDSGPVAFMSLGSPEVLLSTIEADPENSTTMIRATAYGYLATEMADTNGDGNDDSLVPNYAQTLVRDWSLYVAIGLEFQSNGGGSPYTDSEDIANRLSNLLDVDFSDVDCLNLMMNGNGSANPLGLLAQNAAGTGFGLRTFLDMNSADVISTFGISLEQYNAISPWASGWATSSTSIQMALLGANGTMNAGQFVNTTFGAKDPISGGFMQYSLNQGGSWETDNLLDAISLTPEKSGEILYGPLGITTLEGATSFLYGELSGKMLPGYLGANQLENDDWGVEIISSAYDIDQDTAKALQDFLVESIFESFVEDFLIDSFGTEPYLTQSVNSWLLGWHDPVSAYLESGDPNNMNVGWASLESSKTYFGSNGVENGYGTNYTICTGERGNCDKGELIYENGSNQLSWRNDAMFEATSGLITQEEIAGTTGGFITGKNDKVDVSGYAVADIECKSSGVVKGIPVDICEASVNPTERLIQAKLLKTFSLIDAIPSALPIYLGSEIEIKSEELSGLIISGESTTRFYLDSRNSKNMQTEPNMKDLVPVFEIKSSSEIGDEDAEEMESAIVQNQNYFTYWMNFDTFLDMIPFIIWLVTIVFFSAFIFGMVNGYPGEDFLEEENDEEIGLLERLNQQ